MKIEKFKNWDQDNLILLKEAHKIRFMGPRGRKQSYECGSD